MTDPVWVLYDETGQYSDYGKSIIGVFDSHEKAQAEADQWIASAIADHEANEARRAAEMSWLPGRADPMVWSAWMKDKEGRYHREKTSDYYAHSFTVAPYDLNQPKEDWGWMGPDEEER